ncbi:MAG TPA: 2,3-bisphosphoglycerate-independent phosphoglycerate mutase [Candidatus Lokiarchaeia archaeon]|nr:2,3-bisphosphoglycerate-independent phosphoglycerate mutase [Candidatus Lokiarchaeia archaeon]
MVTINKACIVVVIDGVADVPVSPYDSRTPLELANKPNLDRIAREGLDGYIHCIGFWKVGGSDTSHFALLGYDTFGNYTGRGPIEVAGTGVDLQPGDVSIRCNYCTVDDDLGLIDRTAGYVRSSEGKVDANAVNDLAMAVNDEVNLSDADVMFEFRNSMDYRCVVYFRGPGINANISDMDPSYNIIVDSDATREEIKEHPRIVDCAPRDDTPGAKHMADLLTEWVHEVHGVLNYHPVNVARREQGLPPANCIMPRGAGETPVYEPFFDKWGLKGACVAGTGLIKGIGKLTGMHVPNVPGATGYIDSDLMAKGRAAIQCVEEGYEFVLVHIEGTDEVSHDKNVPEKVKMIEKADEMVGYIIDNIATIAENAIVVVLSDHTTSCAKGDHTADPSPIAIWMPTPAYIPDEVPSFSEREACKGTLKHIEGKDLLPLLISLLDKTRTEPA